MPTGRFSKAQRVRRRGEFQKVFDRGVRVHGRYVTLLIAPASGAHSRLGIVASKKLGAAVARNRAKRLIREVFRLNPPHAAGCVDVVAIPRRELFTAAYSSLETDFRSTYRRGVAKLTSVGAGRHGKS
jgi:ribonuclease P protein component